MQERKKVNKSSEQFILLVKQVEEPHNNLDFKPTTHKETVNRTVPTIQKSPQMEQVTLLRKNVNFLSKNVLLLSRKLLQEEEKSIKYNYIITNDIQQSQLLRSANELLTQEIAKLKGNIADYETKQRNLQAEAQIKRVNQQQLITAKEQSLIESQRQIAYIYRVIEEKDTTIKSLQLSVAQANERIANLTQNKAKEQDWKSQKEALTIKLLLSQQKFEGLMMQLQEKSIKLTQVCKQLESIKHMKQLKQQVYKVEFGGPQHFGQKQIFSNQNENMAEIVVINGQLSQTKQRQNSLLAKNNNLRQHLDLISTENAALKQEIKFIKQEHYCLQQNLKVIQENERDPWHTIVDKFTLAMTMHLHKLNKLGQNRIEEIISLLQIQKESLQKRMEREYTNLICSFKKSERVKRIV